MLNKRNIKLSGVKLDLLYKISKYSYICVFLNQKLLKIYFKLFFYFKILLKNNKYSYSSHVQVELAKSSFANFSKDKVQSNITTKTHSLIDWLLIILALCLYWTYSDRIRAQVRYLLVELRYLTRHKPNTTQLNSKIKLCEFLQYKK